MLHRIKLSIASITILFMVNQTSTAAAVSNTFIYDALGRLTNMSDSVNGERKYQYDAAGNRTQVSLGAVANRAPVAVLDYVTVPYGRSVSINVLANDSDPDGDALTIKSFTSCSTVAVNLNGNAFTLYGRLNSPCTFTYTISDPYGAQSTTSVDVTVR